MKFKLNAAYCYRIYYMRFGEVMLSLNAEHRPLIRRLAEPERCPVQCSGEPAGGSSGVADLMWASLHLCHTRWKCNTYAYLEKPEKSTLSLNAEC